MGYNLTMDYAAASCGQVRFAEEAAVEPMPFGRKRSGTCLPKLGNKALFPKRTDLRHFVASSASQDFRGLGDTVGASMVSVDPHEKGAAVCMPEPSGDGGNVHSGFDCGGRKGCRRGTGRNRRHFGKSRHRRARFRRRCPRAWPLSEGWVFGGCY